MICKILKIYSKASGPDHIPNWVVPAVVDILNSSFHAGARAMSHQKLADVPPVPKVPIVEDFNKDLRPPIFDVYFVESGGKLCHRERSESQIIEINRLSSIWIHLRLVYNIRTYFNDAQLVRSNGWDRIHGKSGSPRLQKGF